ncbi:MAG: hypothetical protein WBX09_06005 [Terracidiphilus sp.]
MRTWRIAVWVLLLAAAGVVAWMRFGGHGRTGPQRPAIADLSVTSPLNVPGGAPEPEEAYAVYSALYQEKSNEPLAFADYSSTDIPQVDGSCLKPQTADERAMAEAFEAANKQSHPWEQDFAMAQGYRLLTAGEVNEALECLEAGAKAATLPECAAYKDLRHVRFLGAPGFNADHTRALVSIIRKCGQYCGAGGIFEVEKTGGTWKRAQPGAFAEECSWMFQR